MTDAIAQTPAFSLPLNAVSSYLGFSASAIKSGETWTPSCQRAYEEAGRQLAAAKPLDKFSLEKALSHAINFHSLDSRLDAPDWEIADLLVDQVFAHLAGTTDVQVVERMSPQERDHALREATQG